eukprot:874622-Lingulodinium_polyedra.AAC.1
MSQQLSDEARSPASPQFPARRSMWGPRRSTRGLRLSRSQESSPPMQWRTPGRFWSPGVPPGVSRPLPRPWALVAEEGEVVSPRERGAARFQGE